MHTFLYARVSTIDQTISHQRAQAEATREAQAAGIKPARQADGAGTKYRGRKPTFDVEQLHRTHELLSMGISPSAVSAEVGIPRATVATNPENTSAACRRASRGLWAAPARGGHLQQPLQIAIAPRQRSNHCGLPRGFLPWGLSNTCPQARAARRVGANALVPSHRHRSFASRFAPSTRISRD